jgi:hypothetical protein
MTLIRPVEVNDNLIQYHGLALASLIGLLTISGLMGRVSRVTGTLALTVYGLFLIRQVLVAFFQGYFLRKGEQTSHWDQDLKKRSVASTSAAIV